MRLPGSTRLLPAALAAILIPGVALSTEDPEPAPGAEAPPAVSTPLMRQLSAVPEPGLRAFRFRAAVRTDTLARAATLTLNVGARGAVVRLEPGTDPSGTVIERVVYPARVKLWTPAKPVQFQLEATIESGGRRLDRRVIRFPMRTVEVRDGTVWLNGARLSVRGAGGLSGTTLEADLRRLHAQGFNLVRLGDAAVDPAAREACTANGLLILEDLPAPPAVERAVATEPPAPDAAALDAHGLLAPFGCATAFTEACRVRQADRIRRKLEDLRFDPESPGSLVDGWWTLGDTMARVHAPWLLAARLSRRLVEPGSAPLVTLLLAGPAPLTAGHAAVEWRLLEPVACARGSPRATPGAACPPPAKPPAWRPAPRAVAGAAGVFGAAGAFGATPATSATASAAFALPAVTSPGRWVLEARVRRKGRTLAETREGFGVAAEPTSSQISFALLGASPELERAFGAWLIPAEFADATVVVRPARVAPEALAALGRRLASGRRAVLLALDADDVAALNAARIFGFTLSLTGGLAGPRTHWFRPGPFAFRSPVTRGAVAADAESGATPRWLADEGDEPLLPEASLAPLPGATVWAGSLGPGGIFAGGTPAVPDWGADIQVAQSGAGRVVFCQLRLLEHLEQMLAKLTFLRLLAL
jgi:hypothetical protein